MATETELSQQLDDALANVRKGTDGLVESMEKMMDGNDLSRRSFKKLDKATGGLVSSFNDAAKQIIEGSDSLSVLTGVVADVTSKIPFLGAAISGTVKILGQQAQLGLDAFHKIAASGQLTSDGIEGIARDLRRVDIPIDRWTELLSKSSTNLRYFTGTAIEGRKQFTDTMEALRQGVDRPLRLLGMRIDDIGELTVAFQKMQQRQGIMQDVDQNRRALAAQKYIKQLDLLSKLTGESAKALQAQRDELLADSRYRAWSRRMEREGRGEIAKAMSDAFLLMGKEDGGDQMQEFVKGMIGGTFTGEKAKAIAGIGGGREMLMLTQQLERGQLTGVEYYNRLIEVSKQYPHFAERLQELGFDLGIDFAKLADFSQRSLVTNKALTDAQKAQTEQIRKRDKDEPKDPTAALVDAVRSLNAATGELQSSLVGNGSIAAAFKFTAATTEAIANQVPKALEKLGEVGGLLGDWSADAWNTITGTFDSAVKLFSRTVDKIARFFNQDEWAKEKAAERKEERRKGKIVTAERTIESSKSETESLVAELKKTEQLAKQTPNGDQIYGPAINRLKELIANAKENQETAQATIAQLTGAKPTATLVAAPILESPVSAPKPENHIKQNVAEKDAKIAKLEEDVKKSEQAVADLKKQYGSGPLTEDQQSSLGILRSIAESSRNALFEMQNQSKKLDSIADETKKQSRTLANTN